MAVVLPAIIMTSMLHAQQHSIARRDLAHSRDGYRYAITGDLASRARTLINQSRRESNLEQSEDPEELSRPPLTETTTLDPEAGLNRDEIQFYIDAESSATADHVPVMKV